MLLDCEHVFAQIASEQHTGVENALYAVAHTHHERD